MLGARCQGKPPKATDHYATPDWLYKALDAEFRFDLDPCPLHGEEKQDGLSLDWDGHRVFCNPPYSCCRPWVEKALTSNALTVLLVPNIFDAWWGRPLLDSGAEIRPFRKRISFVADGRRAGRPLNGSQIAVVRRFSLTPST